MFKAIGIFFKKWWFLFALFLLAFSVPIIAMSIDNHYGLGKDFEIKIENVVRIFYHENFRFTYFVKCEDKEIKPVSLTCFYDDEPRFVIYEDAPIGQPMWVLAKGSGNPKGRGMIKNLEIHIHSIKEINGGSWNGGKLGGSGITAVLE